ncbi:MAG: hypothetical protein LCH67_18180 [Bacteroidetes bacterium]|nr:hypothetical protein [Bacteroidota bacterium]
METQIEVFSFLKISKLEYLQDLQKNGKFYCNSFKFFREFEGSPAINDINEGRVQIKQMNDITIFSKGKKIGKANNGQLFIEKYHSGNIYCLFALKNNILKPHGEKIKITDLPTNLGDSVLVIFNVEKFIKKVKTKLNLLGKEFQISPVEYLDFKSHNGYLSPFSKSKLYSDQNEVRIFISGEKEEPFIFEIGDISEISYLCSLEDFKQLDFVIQD